jgi:hypothetical protein
MVAKMKRGNMWWIGFSMSALVVAFLLMDASMKIAAVPPVLKAGAETGFPGVTMARTLGVILLLCTVLLLVPRTAVLGAILVTGFLGGAVATHVRLGSPLFTHVLFGVYVGVLMWGGLVLREPRLREALDVFRTTGGS